MVKIEYASIVVNGEANKEVLKEILTSTKVEKRKVLAVMFTEITPTLQNNAQIILKVENDEIARFDIRQFLSKSGAGDSYIQRKISLDLPLEVGEKFKVGHLSDATASNITYTVQYEEEKAR